MIGFGIGLAIRGPQGWSVWPTGVHMGSMGDRSLTRPVLVSVDIDNHGDAVAAEVVLRFGDETVGGHAMRPSEETNAAVAAATFRALTDATGVVMRTVAAEPRSIANTPLAIVIVEVPALEASLAGCVVVVDASDPEIYAKAALDAINRIVCSPHLLAELAARSAYAG